MSDTSHHHRYIRRCFDLAKRGGRDTLTNPNVGSVLVFEGRVIGEGYHEKYGGPHAEVNCLASVSDKDKHHIKDATLYVSLEPCCIVSKTPACTTAILDNKIKHVVISVTDPNKKVNGHSVQLLESHGVKVEHSLLQDEGLQVIAPFKAHLSGRPYIILKFAQSSDGYMGKRGKQVWITNAMSKLKVHKWRSEIDGILVGHSTVAVDNPNLGTRLIPGDSPTRIILTRDVSNLVESQVYKRAEPSIFISPLKNEASSNNIFITEDYNSVDGLERSMQALFKSGINYLMIEGGAKTHKMFIMSNLWDEARILTSPLPLKSGIRAPIISGLKVREENLDGDRLAYIYRDIKS